MAGLGTLSWLLVVCQLTPQLKSLIVQFCIGICGLAMPIGQGPVWALLAEPLRRYGELETACVKYTYYEQYVRPIVPWVDCKQHQQRPKAKVEKEESGKHMWNNNTMWKFPTGKQASEKGRGVANTRSRPKLPDLLMDGSPASCRASHPFLSLISMAPSQWCQAVQVR